MSTPVSARPGSRPRKPLLGLRRKPGRLISDARAGLKNAIASVPPASRCV